MSDSRQHPVGRPGILAGMTTTAPLDFDDCYRAVASRDARFDGRFITGVTSTGIYCRPSCPAVRPKRRNVRFFRTAAAAQAAGLRACKRCLPDASPGTPEWDLRGDLVGRAMRLISDGTVDRQGVGGLAGRLAVSERHLHRVLVDEVGATPIQLARTQRANTARVLIETTDQPFADVAFAAGFGSIRQFNDTVREVFDASPSQLRSSARRRRAPARAGTLSVRLAYRGPLDTGALLAWFAARAVPGIEEVVGGTLRRSLPLPRGAGVVELEPADGHVRATFELEQLADLPAAVARCRSLLDLDADPEHIAESLGRDEALRPALGRHPGLRVPGTVDGTELLTRAVLGQQVSVSAARTLAGRLVALAGTPLRTASGSVTHVFPSAEAIAGSDLESAGLTAQRAETLRAAARAVADGLLVLDAAAERPRTRERLLGLRGIGPWTVEYVAMRALRDPDAFPASDLVLRRRAEALDLARSTSELLARADRWRPWRAYAAQLLWTHHPDRPDRTGDDR